MRAIGVVALLLPLCAGCVSVAEFRKLERRVVDMQRGGGAGPADERTRLAELGARIDALEGALQRLEGRVEVAEHQAQRALGDARAARLDAGQPVPPDAATAGDPEATPDEAEGASAAEVAAYHEAVAARRAGRLDACVDRFRNFLQTYPSSPYADDSTYWLADCYLRQGNYKTAVVRFDDVVRNFPTGNKAADAAYRQGEALLEMGPDFHQAARNAFERVLKNYPDSMRATEAKRQLELLGSG